MPLGIDRRVPEDRLRIVLRGATPKRLEFFGVDLDGIQLRADDLDWTFGSGTPLSGTARDLLLVLCGRTLPAGRLRGEPSRATDSPVHEPTIAAEEAPHMATTLVIVGLPIADRRTSFVFYRDGLGFEPIGEVADDGVPEPLQFVLNDGVRLMLIPTGGFGWIIGDRDVAVQGSSECVLNLATETDIAVDEIVERASKAGAEIVTAPGHQPWGYAGAFADPDGHVWMVTSQPFPA